MSSDFHGELSIEPVVGVRAFLVDSKGRLRGVTHSDVWRPGENVATCRASGPELPPRPDGGSYANGGFVIPPRYLDFYDPLRTAANQRKAAKKRDKRLAEWKAECIRIREEWEGHGLDRCDHGFWAFYAPSAQYAGADTVYGVVEGYGEVIIGTKGFRASKARIVALSLPPSADEMRGYLMSCVRRNYPDVPAYNSLAQMLDNHELSKNPESDSEGFWDGDVDISDRLTRAMHAMQVAVNHLAPMSKWYGGGYVS